ncbi:PPPDE putative peptidase domain-containing protein [Pilobolus umbonatus]|nr:PPPDE putative peptidase domain-containing protein [Pilobolus umbonatus]
MLKSIKRIFDKKDEEVDQRKQKIILNVYDMLQPGFITNVGFALGVGIFHSGVEIGSQEYCFGGHDYEYVTGVFMVQPKIGPQGVLFKQSVDMGYTDLNEEEIDSVLKDISKEYIGTTYNLLSRNCNHFSDDLCRRLTGKHAPGWVNRAAKLGTMFPCVIPAEWVEPPEAIVTGSETTGSPSSSCSSNTPLHKTTKVKKKSRQSSSGSTDSVFLTRAPVIEDDEINYARPVKEPDTHRPEVIRSATQLSITAPVDL